MIACIVVTCAIAAGMTLGCWAGNSLFNVMFSTHYGPDYASVFFVSVIAYVLGRYAS